MPAPIRPSSVIAQKDFYGECGRPEKRFSAASVTGVYPWLLTFLKRLRGYGGEVTFVE